MQNDGEGDVCKGAWVFICHTRSLCPRMGSGRVKGLQGSFSIKDLIRFSSLSGPPWELHTDFKGVGGNRLNRVLFSGLHPFKC